MSYQETANDDKFILGSAKVEVGTSIATLASAGSLTGVEFASTGEASEIEFDNAAPITKKNLKGCTVKAQTSEIDLAKVKDIFGSPNDTYTATPAAPVAGYSEVVASGAWTKAVFIPFAKQNGSQAIITPTSVTGGTDGLIANTKYTVCQNPSTKEWGIIPLSTITTEAQTLTIVYDYTPTASKTLAVKASNYVPDTFVTRLTHTDDAGKKFQITINKCYSEEFINLTFPKDGGSEIMRMPIAIKGVADANNIAYTIYDERVY